MTRFGGLVAPRAGWLIGAGVLAVLSPFLFGFAFCDGDFQHVFEPLRHVLGEELRAGNILFTTRFGSGEPILASPFQAAVYPPNLLLAIPGIRTASLLSAMAIAHLLWGALGAGLLARIRGAGGPAAVLAATVAGLSALPFSSVSYVLLQTTASWIPWVLLCAVRLGRSAGPSARLRSAAWFALATMCLLLAGDPFMCATCAILLGLFVAVDPEPAASRRVRASLLAAGGLVAVVLVSPFLVAAAKTLAFSQRAGPLPESMGLARSLHPAELLGMALPLPFGNPTHLGPDGYLTPPLTDGRPPLFAGLYVGAVPLALAALGAARRGGTGRAPLLGLLVLTLLALGRHTPLYEWLLGALPGFASGRYPGKWIAGAPLCLGLLSASGLDALEASAGRALRVCLLALAIPAAALVGIGLVPGSRLAAATGSAGPGASPDSPPNSPSRPLRSRLAASAVRAGAIPVVAGLLVLVARRRRPVLLPAALAALVFLDETLVAVPLAPTVDASLYDRVPRAAAAILSDRIRPERVWVDESREALSVPTLVQPGMRTMADAFTLQRERMKQSIGAAYGLSTAFAGDIELLAPVSYTTLRGLVETLGARERSLLLSASAVTHVVSILDRAGPGLELVGRFDVGARRPLSVYRNTRAYPRIRMVPALLLFQGPAQLEAALREGSENLLEGAALVEARTLEPGWASLAGRPGPAGTRFVSPLPADATPRWEVRVLEDRGATIRVETAGSAGFLLVADSYTPAWTARVDGASRPILLADVAFRAVPVPGGRHVTALAYDPWARSPSR